MEHPKLKMMGYMTAKRTWSCPCPKLGTYYRDTTEQDTTQLHVLAYALLNRDCNAMYLESHFCFFKKTNCRPFKNNLTVYLVIHLDLCPTLGKQREHLTYLKNEEFSYLEGKKSQLGLLLLWESYEYRTWKPAFIFPWLLSTSCYDQDCYNHM